MTIIHVMQRFNDGKEDGKDGESHDGTGRQTVTKSSKRQEAINQRLTTESDSSRNWPAPETAVGSSGWYQDRRANYPIRASHSDQRVSQPYFDHLNCGQNYYPPQYYQRFGPPVWCSPNYQNIQWQPQFQTIPGHSFQRQPRGQYYRGQSFSNQPYPVSSNNVTGQNSSDHQEANERMRRHLSGKEIATLINQFRVWKVTKSGREFDERLSVDKHLSSKCIKFNLTSYNILSQDLLDFHNNLYSQCARNVLPWKERFKRLTDEMISLRSNIYCLQEVNEHHLITDLAPFFTANGFQVLYKKRPNKEDGCALVYDDRMFKLVKSHYLELNRTDVHPNLDRENVAIIGLFEPRNPYLASIDSRIAIGTTHLLFNPKRGDIKINQIRLLLAEMSNMARKDNNKASLLNGQGANSSCHMNGQSDAGPINADNYPVILCGDFNTLPGSPIHQFMIKGNN